MSKGRRVRQYRGTITCDVDLDVGDVLMEISDDDLIDELQMRGSDHKVVTYKPPFDECLLDELRVAIQSGKKLDALLLVERMERGLRPPKLSDEAAMQMLKLAPRDPVTRQPVLS